MRLVLTMAMVLASGTVFASSITTLSGNDSSSHSIIVDSSSHSIIVKSCAHCVAAPAKTEQPSYTVPELAPGTQKTEIININGEKKLARTEAWFGGSPVIYVSKVPEWMAQDKSIAEIHPTTDGSTQTMIESAETSSDGVDIAATTGAVKSLANVNSGSNQASAASTPLDLGTFELRTH